MSAIQMTESMAGVSPGDGLDRCAILDELRSMDWVPRSVRQKAHKVEDAYSKLEYELGRPASDSPSHSSAWALRWPHWIPLKTLRPLSRQPRAPGTRVASSSEPPVHSPLPVSPFHPFLS